MSLTHKIALIPNVCSRLGKMIKLFFSAVFLSRGYNRKSKYFREGEEKGWEKLSVQKFTEQQNLFKTFLWCFLLLNFSVV